jgi:glycosyltransferase involved in cell wall biosynthesis
LRILTVSNLYPPDGYGGYERQSKELVQALAALGHEMVVLTCPISTKSTSRESNEVGVRRVFSLANEYMPLVQDADFLAAQLIHSRLVSSHNISIFVEQLSEFRPDIVLLCNILGLGGLQILSVLDQLSIPWVWSLADTIPAKLCTLGELSDLVCLFPVKYDQGIHQIQGAFVSPSERLYQDIVDDRCRLDGALHVVPYWVDDDHIDLSVRQHYNRSNPLRMCFVGYVSANKGMDIVLHATKHLQEKGHQIVLNVYGGGDVQEFQNLADELGLSSSVFHGFKSSQELDELYRQNDVLLFPAMLREPFGNVSLEALMRGCIPIIYEKCGAAEFLQDGVDCLKAERTAGSFVAAVERILAGEIDLATMAANAALSVREQFKISAAAKRYETIFCEKAKPFAVREENLRKACLSSMMVERIAFAQLDRDLASKRDMIQRLTTEVGALSSDLKQAKEGIVAYDMALTGEKNKLAASESRLNRLQSSRIWRLRQLLKTLLKDKMPEI